MNSPGPVILASESLALSNQVWLDELHKAGQSISDGRSLSGLPPETAAINTNTEEPFVVMETSGDETAEVTLDFVEKE